MIQAVLADFYSIASYRVPIAPILRPSAPILRPICSFWNVRTLSPTAVPMHVLHCPLPAPSGKLHLPLKVSYKVIPSNLPPPSPFPLPAASPFSHRDQAELESRDALYMPRSLPRDLTRWTHVFTDGADISWTPCAKHWE